MKKTSPIPIDEYDVKDYKNIAKIFSCESKSVKDSIETITREYCTENAKKEDLDSFYILEISRIVRQYQQWVRHLPRANPFYGKFCFSSNIFSCKMQLPTSNAQNIKGSWLWI